jgi:uncharacterized protein (TIGR04255 family)
MIFPESTRETYERNPLKEVICQLRFPTILKITGEPPVDFQEAVRRGYPTYTKEGSNIALPKEINEFLAGFPISAGLQQSVTHKFETEDRKRFISLTDNFVALSDRGYVEWRNFRGAMEQVERVFQETYQPSYYERIGLRYQNSIDREPLGLASRPWAELLNPSFLGLLAVTEQQISQIRTQSLVKLPDSSPGFVRIVHGFAGAARGPKQIYVIDADFYSDQRSETSNAFRILDDFNRLASRFFRWAITPDLRTALGPRPID